MTELQRLLHIRKRIIGDLYHHIHKINEFSHETDTRIVSFRNVIFEKVCQEFHAITKELETLSAYSQLSNIRDIRNVNQTMRDTCLVTKSKVTELLTNESVPSKIVISADPPHSNELILPMDTNKSLSAIPQNLRQLYQCSQNEPANETVDTCQNVQRPTNIIFETCQSVLSCQRTQSTKITMAVQSPPTSTFDIFKQYNFQQQGETYDTVRTPSVGLSSNEGMLNLQGTQLPISHQPNTIVSFDLVKNSDIIKLDNSKACSTKFQGNSNIGTISSTMLSLQPQDGIVLCTNKMVRKLSSIEMIQHHVLQRKFIQIHHNCTLFLMATTNSNTRLKVLLSIQLSVYPQPQEQQQQSIESFEECRSPINGWICSNRRTAQSSMVHRVCSSNALIVSAQSNAKHIHEARLGIRTPRSQPCYIPESHLQQRTAAFRDMGQSSINKSRDQGVAFSQPPIQLTLSRQLPTIRPSDKISGNNGIKIKSITTGAMKSNSHSQKSATLRLMPSPRLKFIDQIISVIGLSKSIKCTTNVCKCDERMTIPLNAIELLPIKKLCSHRSNQEQQLVEPLTRRVSSIGDLVADSSMQTVYLSKLNHVSGSKALTSYSTYSSKIWNRILYTNTNEPFSKKQSRCLQYHQQSQASATRVKMNDKCLTTNLRLLFAHWSITLLIELANVPVNPKILENLWAVLMHWQLDTIGRRSKLKWKHPEMCSVVHQKLDEREQRITNSV